MLRLITCQRATLLVEKRAAGNMPWGQRASLWVHLHYCPYCNRYAKQSAQVAELAHAAAEARIHSNATLSEAAKARMRERLSAAG